MSVLRRILPVTAGILSVAGCASPSLTLYTLGGPAIVADAPQRGNVTVIEVPRVTVPDYLDTEDILVRHGSVLARSDGGRWATRLSLGATDLLAARFAAGRPDALVTDQPQIEAPSYRIVINISRLDVTSDGVATLDADWQVLPRDPGRPAPRDRAHLNAAGPVATDQEVVTLEERVLNQLADAIDISALR